MTEVVKTFATAAKSRRGPVLSDSSTGVVVETYQIVLVAVWAPSMGYAVWSFCKGQRAMREVVPDDIPQWLVPPMAALFLTAMLFLAPLVVAGDVRHALAKWRMRTHIRGLIVKAEAYLVEHPGDPEVGAALVDLRRKLAEEPAFYS